MLDLPKSQTLQKQKPRLLEVLHQPMLRLHKHCRTREVREIRSFLPARDLDDSKALFGGLFQQAKQATCKI